jgi:cation:H+ antiporter
MNEYASLALGVACAGIGGELFLAGLLGLSGRARVSAGIVAATVAAFATSSPELAIAVGSALAGTPEISLGDALGSNVVNVALILGLAALIAAIHAPRETSRRDLFTALLVPLLLGALAIDGLLSRLDGGVLLIAFVAWLAAVVGEARRQRRGATPARDRMPLRRAAGLGLAGLCLLLLAGRLVVSGAQRIAEDSDIHLFVIGATLVALGTSVPELAIAVISQLRRRHEVGLATVLGSNIFNASFIVGVAALICPIRVAWSEASLPLLFGVATLAVSIPGRRGRIGRERGLLLLALYALYVALLLRGAD